MKKAAEEAAAASKPTSKKGKAPAAAKPTSAASKDEDVKSKTGVEESLEDLDKGRLLSFDDDPNRQYDFL